MTTESADESGVYYDIKGCPFHKGDLVRSLHFIGRRKKRHYLYHTVVNEGGALFMVPTSHLEPTRVKGGGKAPLKYFHKDGEIIHGHGPGSLLSYTDRQKIISCPENGQ